jgi:hypothetical protein
MNFKKYYIILAILTYSGNINAQKIVEDKVDKFNGDRTVRTNYVALSKTLGVPLLSVSGSAIIFPDTTRNLYMLMFTYKAGRVLSLDKKHSAILKFKSGKIMTLPYSGSYDLVTSSDNVLFLVQVMKDQLKELTENEITDIRIESSSWDNDYEIKDKFQKSIPEVAELLLKIK